MIHYQGKYGALRRNGSLKGITIAECTEQAGRILYQEKCYVLEDDWLPLRFIQEHHDAVLAGHPSKVMTFYHPDRQYHWKYMWRQVDQYI